MADDANGNAVITLGAGETITLQGVDAASITANDFVFDQTPATENAGSMTISDGAILPLSGVVNNTGTIVLDSTGDETNLELIQRGMTLQGGGQLTLSDSSENAIFGTDPSVTFTNVDNTITGAGQLGEGQLTLINGKDGTIDATGGNSLVIDTGGNPVINYGTLEATGSGGLVVQGDLDLAKSGSLWANGGNVTVSGNVSGNGVAKIDGSATLEFGAAASSNLTFDPGATGALRLDQSSAFSGTVSGFTAGDKIDLADVSFGADTTLGYADNGLGTGGTLTVSDGTHTANIALLGQYIAASFVMSADGLGGTLIHDPPPEATLAQTLTQPLHA